jgi:Protein of unknown function (DUF2798)
MDPNLPGHARAIARRLDPKFAPRLDPKFAPRLDPKFAPRLDPALMAVAMSLVGTITKHGLAHNLMSAWFTSFALGVVVAVPTAILLAPRVQRLVGHLTGAPRHTPTAATQDRPRAGRREEGT